MASRRIRVGRRLAIALALTIGPTLALCYFGFRALEDRERSVRLSVTSGATLVRDRFLSSLAALDENLKRGAGQLDPSDVSGLQAWLRSITDQANVESPFLATSDGAVVTAHLWTGWPLAARSSEDALSAALREAEFAEFVRGDLEHALQLYRQAVSTSTAPVTRAAALTRVGRTLHKLRRPAEATLAYEQARLTPSSIVDPFGLPYRVIAEVQLNESTRSGDLLRYVLDHPWETAASYGFYLRHALAETRDAAPDLVARGKERLADLERFERIVSQVAPALSADIKKDSVRIELAADSTAAFASVTRIATASGARPALFAGFLLRRELVAGKLLSDAASGVDLWADTEVRLVANASEPIASSLATLTLGDELAGYSIAIVDRQGRTLSQLTSRDRWTYGALLAGVLAVLLAGVAFMTRAWTREAELSRLRTDFVSNVSHELKTPLALIRMFGETLESGVVDDAAKRQEFYGIIRRESERLTHLINNVLDAAKIEGGTRQFVLEPADLVALVRDALDAYGALFKRLDVEIAAALPEEPINIRIDRDAVAQALVNLFQNAIRYAGEGRYVGVTVQRSGDLATVAVADHGPGIPAAELKKIFDKFYRSQSTAGSTAGSGLGLAIVKHVMGVHGGRVDVDSVVGQGSVFTLVFPIQRGIL